MIYSSAIYIQNPLSGREDTIKVTINGNQCFVPVDTSNSDYTAMMALVTAGQLTIAPAAG